MHPFEHHFLTNAARWLALIFIALASAFPEKVLAAKAGGGTTTTMALTYVNGVQRWVARIDPLNVQAFQLDVVFNPGRCQLDQAVGLNGVRYKFPFEQTTPPDPTQPGRIADIAGMTANTSPGDVDIFELVFIDLNPGAPIDGVTFSVVASPNDSIVGFDPVTLQSVVFDFTQIAPTTRTSAAGVDAHIWDPDTLYNNGTTGGPGTWDTSSSSWDDLPIGPPFVDTAWNNNTHANDIAVFGGNPGVVNLAVPIALGGFQFEISGYNIQGNLLVLSTPSGAPPVIDTGANMAQISSVITGNNLTKAGSGTLILSGANDYTGTTFINEGTLLVNNSSGSGTGQSAIEVPPFGVLGGTGMIGGPVTLISAGPLPGGTLMAGDGTAPAGALTLANDVDLVGATGAGIVRIVLGPAGAHSTLIRAGGTWMFSPGQQFTFVDLGAAPGFYNNIITGLAADPGDVPSWTITTPGFAGDFSYDGAGNIDVNITTVPPPPALQLTKAVSRKKHGGSGVFDLNLPFGIATTPAVECRRESDGTFTFMFTFSNAITAGSANVTGGMGNAASPVIDGNIMTVNVSSVPNQQQLTLTLSNVTDTYAQVLPNTAVSVRMLAGDTTADRRVNVADASQTKSNAGNLTNPGNFRTDVNVDGRVNVSDANFVKARSGNSL